LEELWTSRVRYHATGGANIGVNEAIVLTTDRVELGRSRGGKSYGYDLAHIGKADGSRDKGVRRIVLAEPKNEFFRR
jgi:hypothetical protein